MRGAARRLLRRPRPRDRRRRRRPRGRVGAAGRGRGRTGRRQLGGVPHGPRRPARDRRGQPRGPRPPPEGHLLVRELHDDGADHRARAAAPRRAHRPHGRVDVPVGVGRGSGRLARARRAVEQARGPHRRTATRGHARRSRRRGRGLVEADRGQRDPARGLGEGRRVHVGGVEDGPRDAEDPPRRRDQDRRSRACASRCSSATRCR